MDLDAAVKLAGPTTHVQLTVSGPSRRRNELNAAVDRDVEL